MAKRQRSINYTNEETMKLINLVTEYKDIIENKKTDAVTWHEKKDAWEKISCSYNSCTTNTRTADQLRQKFDTLKKDARKYSARRRQRALQTGGGPPAPDTKENFILEAILQLILLSAVGLHSEFDCDVVETVDPMETAQVRLPDDVLSNLSTVNMQILPDNTETACNADNIEACDGGIITFPWNSYTPQMLQKPIHPALSVHTTTPTANKPALNMVSVAPSTSKQVLAHSATPSTSSKKAVVHSVTPSTSMEPQDVDAPTMSVHLASEEGRAMLSASSTPKNWATRRRSMKKTVVRRPSASGRMLEPWAQARKNLAVTQRNLLIKEFRANEERKKNIYSLQKNNLLLEKRSLELDIEIKLAKLEKMNNL